MPRYNLQPLRLEPLNAQHRGGRTPYGVLPLNKGENYKNSPSYQEGVARSDGGVETPRSYNAQCSMLNVQFSILNPQFSIIEQTECK